MGRHKKPTHLLELEGAFEKDPQRRRVDPPAVGPLGDVPASFAGDDELGAIWAELEGMAPANVLTCSDRWLVELACRMMALVRTGAATSADRNSLVGCLARMGLTPADRSKIGIQSTKEAAGGAERDALGELALRVRSNLRTQ